MQRIPTWKRTLSMTLVSAMTATALLTAPTAQAAESGSLLILGDSISAGYGLKEGELGYYDYLADCTGYKTTNLAVSGAKTSDLLTLLGETDAQASVAKADLICISIGANDLLEPARLYFEQLMEPGEELTAFLQRLYDEGSAFEIMANLTGILRPKIETALANLQLIADTIRQSNADAPIVVQSIYNIAEMYTTEYQGVDYSDVYTKLNGFVKGQCKKVNNGMAAMEGLVYADVAAAFADTGWLYVRSRERDIHPTPLGHALIAVTILDTLAVQSGSSPAIWKVLDGLSAADTKTLPADDRTLLERYAGTRQNIEPQMGDINADGSVDADDATVVLRDYTERLAGVASSLTAEQLTRADVVKDGVVNATDATIILQYYVITITGRTPTWEELIA